MLDALIPPVFHADGQKKMLEYIGDPSVRQKVREMTDGTDGAPWENWVGSCGWEGILINSVGSEKNRWVEGKNMAEIAAESSRDPVDALCDLLVEESGTATMTQFYGCEKDVETIMSHESMLFCSDSIVGGKPHPRAYGSTARILGRYVRERGTLSLAQAVRLGLQDRGIVREGMKADLVAFDPAAVGDRGTYQDPVRYPAGFSMTVVSGHVAMIDGELTGARAGGALRRR